MLKSPMMASPTLSSAFSPYTDSPSSPAPYHQSATFAQRSSSNSDSLAPPPSPYPQFVDPSPVDSNGTASTEATDIDDDAQDESRDDDQTPEPAVQSNDDSSDDKAVDSPSKGALGLTPISPSTQLDKIDTTMAARTRSDSDTGPQSVIHAPQDFGNFDSQASPNKANRVTPSPTGRSENTIISPRSPETPDAQREPITFLNTNISSVNAKDRPTPRAQTRQDVEDEWDNKKRQSKSLEDIPEGQDDDGEDYPIEQTARIPKEQEQQIVALKTALSECWTLCNTLAGLSSNHRTRIFAYRGQAVVQEQAWRCCWKLCQNLYESRDEDHDTLVLPTLEMCKEFCLALFEARQKGDEITDSVLRVSFELNNHLYNTQDRELPGQFQERTLDFYLTLCHRLMKQRTSLPEETDALLRACWGLAEMLFSLRQNKREKKPEDEELLGSAVQACWDLCDLFREGWTQVRPDRGTPRPAATTFTSASSYSSRSASERSSPSLTRSSSNRSYNVTKPLPPETPTTIFDDTGDTVESLEDNNVPNILVLGPDQVGSTHHNRWSSSASTLSTYSDASASQRSSNTAKANDAHLNYIRILLVQAANNAGFVPRSPPPLSSSASSRGRHAQQQSQTLLNFVKALPSNTFGQESWQRQVFEKYRKLVLQWPISRTSNQPILSANTTRVSAAEVARAVQWMMRVETYVWLRDLYRIVFGCFPDDGINRAGSMIQA